MTVSTVRNTTVCLSHSGGAWDDLTAFVCRSSLIVQNTGCETRIREETRSVILHVELHVGAERCYIGPRALCGSISAPVDGGDSLSSLVVVNGRK